MAVVDKGIIYQFTDTINSGLRDVETFVKLQICSLDRGAIIVVVVDEVGRRSSDFILIKILCWLSRIHIFFRRIRPNDFCEIAVFYCRSVGIYTIPKAALGCGNIDGPGVDRKGLIISGNVHHRHGSNQSVM